MLKIKKDKFLNIIGLMSGTSLDGIDISLVKTNGNELFSLNKNYYFKYNDTQKQILKKITLNYKKYLRNLEMKIRADNYISALHLRAIKKSGYLKQAEIIGFHGQTIFHDPRILSCQLGNPKILSKRLKKDIVYNFREKDIINDGQGAPLAPIYHKYLISKYKLELPSCVLNIGGISNLSYWDGKKLIGFDTGPGNSLMDDYIQLFTNFNFDQNGILASKGKVNTKILQLFMNNNFFKKSYPKSLDKFYFKKEFKKLIDKKISLEDALCTLLEITLNSILNSFKILPSYPRSLIICGGGKKNTYLISQIKEKSCINIFDLDYFKHNSDFVEAELIAFLAARFIFKLPSTFPLTTGVQKPIITGEIIKNHELC